MKGRRKVDVMTRAWSMISTDNQSGCWLWTGFVESSGYARIELADGSKKATSALFFEYHVGEVTDGHYVAHLCANKHCCNPSHLTLRPDRADVLERILRRTVKAPSGCWEWQGCRADFGHGKIGLSDGKNALVHRVVYERMVGPIPDGLLVCHHCDNPPCCNPEHLFVGTHKDNSEDMVKKGRSWDRSGLKNPNVKLTREKIADILASKEWATVLGKRLGVNPETVRRVRRGESFVGLQ